MNVQWIEKVNNQGLKTWDDVKFEYLKYVQRKT